MFTSSHRNESSSLLKKATGAFLAYKALPIGRSRKDEGSLSRKILGSYIVAKAVPKAIKWIGGGALLAYAISYGYSKYNTSRSNRISDNNYQH